jgi:hypothetical protein
MYIYSGKNALCKALVKWQGTTNPFIQPFTGKSKSKSLWFWWLLSLSVLGSRPLPFPQQQDLLSWSIAFFKFLLLHAPLHCVILHAGYTFISCICDFLLRWISVLCCFSSGVEAVIVSWEGGAVLCLVLLVSVKNAYYIAFGRPSKSQLF